MWPLVTGFSLFDRHGGGALHGWNAHLCPATRSGLVSGLGKEPKYAQHPSQMVEEGGTFGNLTHSEHHGGGEGKGGVWIGAGEGGSGTQDGIHVMTLHPLTWTSKLNAHWRGANRIRTLWNYGKLCSFMPLHLPPASCLWTDFLCRPFSYGHLYL